MNDQDIFKDYNISVVFTYTYKNGDVTRCSGRSIQWVDRDNMEVMKDLLKTIKKIAVEYIGRQDYDEDSVEIQCASVSISPKF